MKSKSIVFNIIGKDTALYSISIKRAFSTIFPLTQCCLISGESGSGKTVSSNFLVQQLAELGKARQNKKPF